MPKTKTGKQTTEAPQPKQLAITFQIPEGTASQYPNHLNVQARQLVSGGDEITFTFWQVQPFSLDLEAGTGVAVFLGSYVMPRGFAERFVEQLADNLDYQLSRKEQKTDA
jgi:hypothetical protein